MDGQDLSQPRSSNVMHSDPPIPPTSAAKQTWKLVQDKYGPEFVWICTMPYNGAYMVRMFPAAEFAAMLERNERACISKAAIFTTRHYKVAEGGSPSGALYLEPDFSSTYAHPSQTTRRVEIMSSWVDAQGVAVEECARSKLSFLHSAIHKEFRLTVLVGFEVEVVFQQLGGEKKRHDVSQSADQEATLCMIETIVRALQKANILVRQFHAEAAPDQWEFALGPDSPLEAVDRLVRARQIIAFVAKTHGRRATLHPRPIGTEAGTGAHVHISAALSCGSEWSDSSISHCDRQDSTQTMTASESFFAGILHHLRAVCAFSLPLDTSYDRVRSGIWSGGEYVCWGWQNRETAMRRISRDRFEVRTVCGTANPYLTLLALLAAGLDGLRRNLRLAMSDCQQDPSKLSDSERLSLGIDQHLPASVEESLEMLERDAQLRETIGLSLAAAYSAVTRAWNQQLRTMSEHDRHEYLLANY